MTAFLKQSTTVTIQMGPFLDAMDGVTEETALSPVVEVSKNGGVFAARNSTTAITHDQNGWYRVELNSTDTNTVGRLVVKSDNSATHLPVWHEFMVLPANVYDSLVGGTDKLQVDAVEISSSITAADNVEANIGNLDAAVSTRATPAQVNMEVLDVLNTDTFAQPASVPPATTTLVNMIRWMFALSRNKITQTATAQTLRNDADSASIATASVSDNGTTFTRGKWT